MKKLYFLWAGFSAVFLNAQVALDQTTNGTNEQIYKTIAFANGSEAAQPHPSYSIVGTKNIDIPLSDSYGSRPSFWRSNGNGGGTFVNTTEVGGSSNTTVGQEIVGGHTLNWEQAQSLQKNISSVNNSLGINFTGKMKRAHADVNNDGQIDAKLTTYTLPSGAAAQAAGFQIGDVAIFATPEISASNGATLLPQQFSYKTLNANREWEDSLDGPQAPGWTQDNIIDWISEALATHEVESIKTTIYPNPAQDFVPVKTNQTENFSFQIFDLSGKLVKAGKSKSNEKIDVQNL